MIMSTAEYKYLFRDKPIEEITNKDIEIERGKRAKANLIEDAADFRTFKEIAIVTDKDGISKIAIVERTGFEGEGF